MRLNSCILAVVTFSHCLFGDVLLQGRVAGHIGNAIQGAAVSIAGVGSTTTNSAGEFTLQSSTSADSPDRTTGRGLGIYINHGNLYLDGVRPDRQTRVRLHSLSGRMLLRAAIGQPTQTSRARVADLSDFGPGTYLLRVTEGNATHTVKVLIMRERAHRVTRARQEPGNVVSLAKKTAPNSMTVTATGYVNRTVDVLSDTSLDILVTLYPTGFSVPSAVTVTESTETMNFRVPFDHANSEDQTDNWANRSVVRRYITADWGGSRVDSKTYNVIHLDNEYVRVTISPDLGMRILRVIDKTNGSDRHMFEPWGYLPEWPDELHMNSGGVKASFPFFEHPLGVVDETGSFDAKSGFYIERDIDGGVRVVMNLRFDHYQDERDMSDRGKFGDRSLSQVVTLKPGRADFEVRFIANNPNPLRRNRIIWSCALMPRESPTAWGGDWIFPTHWAMDHEAKELFDIATNGPTQSYSYAYFGLYIPHPFLGAYYANGDANHLRITDPVAYPGAKIVDMQVFREVWGSNGIVFERPEGWLNGFETCDLELRFYMSRGLGRKVSYANEYVAIATDNNQFAMAAPTPTTVTVYEYNQTTSPKMTDQTIGPETVATGTFTQGLRVVSGGIEVCNVSFPLELPDNSSLYPQIRQECLMALVSDAGADSVDISRGEYYEMSGVTAKGNGLSCLAVMGAAAATTSSDDADILISLANTAYRVGQFGIVEDLLTKVNGRRPEQANYLQALIALERGTQASFDNTVIEGKYFAALAQVKAGNTGAAIAALDELLAQRPGALDPLLLRAYLRNDLTDAAAALRLDPGAVEVWTVLNEMGYPGAGEKLTGILDQSTMATVRRDDFLREITEGTWRHNRRYEYDASWFELASFPDFPDSLKYVIP